MSTERRKALLSGPFIRGILVFSLFAMAALVWFRVSSRPESYDAKRASVRLEKLENLRKDDAKKLGRYAWANPQKGIVQIPVGRAMEIELMELKNKPVQPTGVKVENPYPTGLTTQQPAPAAAKEAKK